MARQRKYHIQEHLHLLLIISYLFVSIESLNEEGNVLLAFKQVLVDPYNNLQSWNSLDSTPCNWSGIACTEDFKGTIPPRIGVNSNLTILDMSANDLVGGIPPQLCKFQKLIFLSLGSNSLSGNIPHDLKTCKPLMQLMLGDNQLTGSLPVELSKLHNLSALELYQNRFSGLIPPELGLLKNLERLLLSDNYFKGFIPSEIGKLVQLVTFNLSSNQLSSNIPFDLGNCTKLQRLDLSRNQFTGFLPDELGKLVNLELLKLSDNRLSGPIPGTLGGLARLTELQMGGNYFSGSIPVELGQLVYLQIALNFSHNALSGTIPSNLGNLQMLESLYLNDNQLVGEIPASIGELMSLLVCNLSNNNLTGALPNTPVFRKMDSSNFAGNNGLCGLSVSHCHQSSAPSSSSSWLKDGSSKEKLVSIISVIIGLISLIFIVGVCWAIKRRQPTFVSLENQVKPDMLDNYYFPKKGFTYQDLVEATGNFSDSAIIGKGACGTVYKAVMSKGPVIAVKKLKSCGEGATIDSSFHAEISTLGNISHRNIVKLYGFCYHQDSNVLLYEYMANGSLGEQLHGDEQTCLLDWNARYKIALGAAEGLCYLHYDCKPQIIHRDIKSNNILLDEMFEAHVGDFGLAKLIDFPCSKSMSAVAGSYGYIAPEYAYTMKVTEKCDIYSFGVVLLELITGRSPVQPLDQGGDLVTWARRSVHAAVPMSEIYDKRLDLSERKTIEEMFLVLKIALFCTSSSPFNRPTMREVIAMMIDARESVSTSTSSPTSETPLEEVDSSRDCMEP
ncbi:leucine-rich repeat receptor-like serine/threonine-protein kinase At1g17230 isoform X2 [Camellia sinensis]|uniref:leucine-rich repeat receptor-like serine/threonine-protein kinase At1g17230 isoform X2 n=1 Tax=Camellia sinensis TaxID=4442 RepID=UPI0010359F88|nr:leucine-rich repeat receptor-like serine/threonine-protein kinase At1g17230 isoform X2 [Camellia sinensis]